MTFRQLLAKLGPAEVARRLHRSERTVRGWKGSPPKSAAGEVKAMVARSTRARKAAKAKYPKTKRERALKRELERTKRQLRELEERQLNYWDRLERERQKHDEGLIPYRTVKSIAALYGLPVRQVWIDYVSPPLGGRRAA